MKILHVLGKCLKEGNGITSAVPPLIEAQNSLEGIEAKALFTSAYEEYNFNFETLHLNQISNIDEFLLKTFTPDIVIFHEVYYLSFLKISKLLFRLNIPYLIKPHCSLTKLAQQKSKYKKMLANHLLFNTFIARSKAISFLNEQEFLTSIQSENHIIVNNGVKVQKIDLNSKINKRIRIIYLSRIDYYHKGLDFLIDGLKTIKKSDFSDYNFEIFLYGDGAKTDLDRLNKDIKELNNEHISFKGPVYDINKEKVFKESNIFILTSRLEGMPMGILEALSFGMPCIVTPGTNMAEEIQLNNVGWVTSTDKDCIANTILKAVTEYKIQRETYIKNSLDLVKNKYNWDNIAKDTIKKYQKYL